MIGFTQLGYKGLLANQMFQYAMLKGVSKVTGFDVGIPKKFTQSLGENPFNQMGWVELKHFNLICKELNDNKFEHSYEEKQFEFNNDVFNIKDNTDFIGYFQSYKYFEHIEEDIRKEFTFSREIDILASQYINKFERPIVALHVRRGTYLFHKETHRIMPMEYYLEAMKMFKNSTFLIFSDDINWCKNNFKGNQFYFSETNNHWLDMAIMSKCDNYIIAASSFSWWGAWLNTKDKKVIAPKTWFGPKFSHYNTKDLLPEDWIKIDSVKRIKI